MWEVLKNHEIKSSSPLHCLIMQHQMTTYKQGLYQYGVFILSITGMIVNLGAIVHLVKQEWVQLWFPLSATVPTPLSSERRRHAYWPHGSVRLL